MEALRKNSVNYGLILGLVLVVLSTISYAIDLNLFTKPWFGISFMVVIIIFGALAAVKSKKRAGGFFPFKDAFVAYFITVIIGLLISTLYSIILFNVIDPEAKAVIAENVIKYTTDMMQNFGAKAADINKVVADMQKTDSFGPGGQLQGLLFNIILYSIIGLITALVVKKDRPQSL